MWLLFLSVPLLPAVAMVSHRHRVTISALCGGVLSWVLGRGRGRGQGAACARSTHAFVFSECTHGKADSVLATFDLYAETHPSLSLGPQRGQVLDKVVRRVAPRLVLELGMHCGYGSIRMLRLLPPAGRLLTVEGDPLASELGEELLLVAGFKHHQFQVLTCSSVDAIASLRPHLGSEDGTCEGLDLVMMDHDPQRYLEDLVALDAEGLLRPSGCYILLVHRDQGPGASRALMEQITARNGRYALRTEENAVMELYYCVDG